MKNGMFWKAVVLALGLVLTAGCSVKLTERDPDEAYHYDERYDYTDLHVMRDKMVDSLLASKTVVQRDDKPIVVPYPIENRTSEHIDTKNLMDSIQTALHASGKLDFAAKDARAAIEKELGYQASGKVDPSTRVKVGKQLGAQYLLSGRLNSIEKEAPKQVRLRKRELVYYKLTMVLTDLETGLIAWTDEQEIAREASKPFIGW